MGEDALGALGALGAMEALRASIECMFPKEAAVATARLASCGFDESAHIIWLEEFGRTTTMAIAAQDDQTVDAHLGFMSQQWARGGESVRSAIDVAYVEPLLSGLKIDRQRWAWARMPAHLKKLYTAMWGEPRFK